MQKSDIGKTSILDKIQILKRRRKKVLSIISNLHSVDGILGRSFHPFSWYVEHVG